MKATYSLCMQVVIHIFIHTVSNSLMPTLIYYHNASCYETICMKDLLWVLVNIPRAHEYIIFLYTLANAQFTSVTALTDNV